MRAKLPNQPIVWAPDGVIRFQANRIVGKLYDMASNGYRYDLNAIAIDAAHGAYTREEQSQFAQLIGYSVSGFGDLSYVPAAMVAECDQIELSMAEHPRAKQHKAAAIRKKGK